MGKKKTLNKVHTVLRNEDDKICILQITGLILKSTMRCMLSFVEK